MPESKFNRKLGNKQWLKRSWVNTFSIRISIGRQPPPGLQPYRFGWKGLSGAGLRVAIPNPYRNQHLKRAKNNENSALGGLWCSSFAWRCAKVPLSLYQKRTSHISTFESGECEVMCAIFLNWKIRFPKCQLARLFYSADTKPISNRMCGSSIPWSWSWIFEAPEV